MPTYDYRCTGCGHEMAVFQGITEDALTVCPECGKPDLRRLIGAGAGIIFKGSGFYETDYKRARNSPSPSRKSDDSGGGDKKDSGGEKKTDSKKPSEKKSESSE